MKFEPTRYDLGAERYLATGEVLPDSVLAEIRGHDAILLGAVGGKPGDPNLPPGILERGLLLRLRFELDHYVNLPPVADLPGRHLAAGRPGARSTSWWSARAPRVPTSATAARCASARRTRSRPRSASTRRTASSASSATRSPGRQPAAQEAHPGPQDQRARPRRRGLVAAGRARWPPSSPTSRSTTSTSTRPRSS